jgi:hypothetical protein
MGVGKSRLVYELTSHLRSQKTASPLMLVCQCWDYQQCTGFYPVARMLESQLQLQPEHSSARREETLRLFVRRFGLDPSDVVPVLSDLIRCPAENIGCRNSLDANGLAFQGAEAGQRREQMLDTLERLLLAMAQKSPVLLLLKDLHWADSSTQELLRRVQKKLVAPDSSAKILIVISLRRSQLQPLGDGEREIHLPLLPLKDDDARRLVQCVAQKAGNLLSEDAISRIVAEGRGRPYILRQVAAGDPDEGSWMKKVLTEAQGDLESSKNAHGLHGVYVAQVAAVLGRSFSYETLRAVVFDRQAVPDDDAVILQRHLQHLVDAGILCANGKPPQAKYQFVGCMFDGVIHSLTRDNLESQHYRVGKLLAERLASGKTVALELIARQFAEAGERGSERAAYWWGQVAEVALNGSAYNEAITAIDQAMGCLLKLPDSKERKTRELRLWLDRALASGVVQTSDDVKRAYSQAMVLAQETEETALAFRAQWGHWLFTYILGQLPSAMTQAQDLLTAPACQDHQCRLEAFHAMWDTLFHLGHLRTALAYHFHGATIPGVVTPEQHRRGQAGHAAQVCCLARGALVFWFLGFVDQAVDVSWRAIKLAEDLGHPNSVAHAQCHAALLHLLRRYPTIARKHAQEAQATAGKHSLGQRRIMAEVLESAALLQERPDQDTLAKMKNAIIEWRKTGVKLFESLWLTNLAEGYLATRSASDGLKAIDEALALTAGGGEKVFEPEIYRIRGELIALQHPKERASAVAEATGAIQRAIEIEARPLELRALLSLNRLLESDRSSRNRKDALARLRGAYEWFREGRETPDLDEARTYLESH